MTRAGFTLMEVVVSITLAFLVAVAVHRGLGEISSAHERSASRRDEVAEAAAIRRQVGAWLRGAFVSDAVSAGAFEGEDGGSTAAPSDRLRFRTVAPGFSGPHRVELGIDGEAGTESARLVARIVGSAPETEREILLVPGARGFQARYLLDLGDQLLWVDHWSSTARLPRAVELRIEGEGIPPLLRAPFLIVLSGG